MQENRLQGSYYEMGLEQGRNLKKWGFVAPPATETKLKFAKACEALVQEHLPELLEELRGMADGGSFEPDLLNALVLTLDAEPACSVFAVAGTHTVDGKTLFGRNYDMYVSFRDFITLYRTYPAVGLASLGCSDIFVGREDGINEAGLAIGMSYVGYHGDQPGILFHLALRAVLDRCSNVEQAIRLLKSIPHMRNNNYLVADSSGQIAIVEAGPQQVSATYPPDGFAAITNHFQFNPYERVKGRPTNSESRLCNLKEWFTSEKGRMSNEKAQVVLSNPEKGVFCSHYEEEGLQEPIVTLWSWYATLGERNVQLSEGDPDRHTYKTYEF